MVRLLALTFLLLLAATACSVDGSSPSPTPAVTTNTPDTPAQAAPTAAPSPTPAPSGRVRLNAVGDLMLERDIITMMDVQGSVHPFAAVREVLADADITIANMEGTFTERGVRADKFYAFRTPPRHAAGLAQGGIDVVSLGNNHTMDFGPDGLTDTLAAIDAAGVARSGAGADLAGARAPAFLEANGLRIAFLSYNAVLEATFAVESSPGVARGLRGFIQSDVPNARNQADIVVVSLHAGTEYTDAPTAEQRSLARTAIDAGAALVLGHHPHVLQGWERYNGGLIVYSLGNFVFDLDYDDLATLGPRPFQTLVLHVELDRGGFVDVSYTPVFIDPGENRPLPATAQQAAQIEQRLEHLHTLVR